MPSSLLDNIIILVVLLWLIGLTTVQVIFLLYLQQQGKSVNSLLESSIEEYESEIAKVVRNRSGQTLN